MEGPSAQRAAIAARLASQLGVACITGVPAADDAIRQGHSCVIAADGGVHAACGCLRVCLHDGDAAPDAAPGCHLCLDVQLLGVNGSAELLKQFAVQRLMTRRASSRRV